MISLLVVCIWNS